MRSVREDIRRGNGVSLHLGEEGGVVHRKVICKAGFVYVTFLEVRARGSLYAVFLTLKVSGSDG